MPRQRRHRRPNLYERQFSYRTALTLALSTVTATTLPSGCAGEVSKYLALSGSGEQYPRCETRYAALCGAGAAADRCDQPAVPGDGSSGFRSLFRAKPGMMTAGKTVQ